MPVLVMHSEDDQIAPFADSGPLTAKLLVNATFKVYQGLPHGMPTPIRRSSTPTSSPSSSPEPAVREIRA